MNWTIGADIEVMLEKNGKLVSAIPVLPPDDQGVNLPNGKIFYDNVLAEFTVTPSTTEDEFVKNILDNLAAARDMMKQYQIKFRMTASAHYPKSELNHPHAIRFGCSPDYDAYARKVNMVAATAEETTLRTAGAHIHFSHEIFKDPLKILEMIKMMDLMLGIPSITMDNTPEAVERRTLYGKAGAHRPKRYPGGEYRPLSNFWAINDGTIRWAYRQTEKCLRLIVKGETIVSLGYKENDIRRIINEADLKAAASIVQTLDKIKYD